MPFDVVYYRRTDTKFQNPFIHKAENQGDADNFKKLLRSLGGFNIKNEVVQAPDFGSKIEWGKYPEP